jgi:hypothetical protein
MAALLLEIVFALNLAATVSAETATANDTAASFRHFYTIAGTTR